MDRGTYFGHVTEHVALELSSLAGREVSLGRTMWAGADGRYDVMMECPRGRAGRLRRCPALLVRAAIRVTEEVLAGPAARQSTRDVAEITGLAERERLGISTAAIAAAARRRGLPVRRVGRLSMLRLGYGCARRLVCAALTEQTSALGRGHRGRQDAGQAAAGRRRDTGAAGRRGGHRGRGPRGAGPARRAGRDQAAGRQPRAVSVTVGVRAPHEAAAALPPRPARTARRSWWRATCPAPTTGCWSSTARWPRPRSCGRPR